MLKTLVACIGLLLAGAAYADVSVPPVSPIAKVEIGCTAFYVGKDRWVTASHCYTAGDDKSFTILLDNGAKLTGALALVSNVYSGQPDIMIFTVKTPDTIKPLNVACETPKEGTDVFMKGFPDSLGELIHYGKTASGILPGTTSMPWKKVLHVDIASYGGYSGSAVQEVSTGAVVGILVGSMSSYENFSVAVPSEFLCGYLKVLDANSE